MILSLNDIMMFSIKNSFEFKIENKDSDDFEMKNNFDIKIASFNFELTFNIELLENEIISTSDYSIFTTRNFLDRKSNEFKLTELLNQISEIDCPYDIEEIFGK